MTKSRARALGHPVHPMLVMFPVALFITALIFDVIHAFGGGDTFAEVGFWAATVGLVGGVFAAITGFIDWAGIPSDSRAKGIGARHGVINAAVMAVFLIVWLARIGRDHHTAGWLTWLELIAVAAAGVSAWLGGEMIYRHGIGVEENANLDAPSSVAGARHRPR